MKEITLTIGQQQVYDEVAKTTSYVGAKMADETAYDRIFTTDEDQEMLARFWQESKAMVVTSLKRWLLDEVEEDGAWKIHLGLSQAWDEALAPDMERSMLSFFVLTITAKWFTMTNKDDAEGYATQAAAHLDSLLQKVYHKKMPVRPTYEDGTDNPYAGYEIYPFDYWVEKEETIYDIEAEEGQTAWVVDFQNFLEYNGHGGWVYCHSLGDIKEDENVLFSFDGKLYRYDSDTHTLDEVETPTNDKLIKITIKIPEVLYDIKNRSALMAEARKASGAAYEVVSALRVTDDEDRMYHIKRAIATAFATLKSASAEYVPAHGWTADNLVNEEIENNGELVMVFTLPKNYDRAAVQMLGKGIHDYFVETALGEWLALISAEDSATYATAAASSMLLVRSALNKRHRPRRPQYRKGE